MPNIRYDIWTYRYESATGKGLDQIRIPATTPVASHKEALRLASEQHPTWSIYSLGYLGVEEIEDDGGPHVA